MCVTGLVVIGIFQSPVMGHRVPCSMTLWDCLSLMVTFCLSKMAMQPASQSFGIEMRDVPFKAGNRWLSRAAVGSSGMLSLAVCVDCMVLLSGK